MKSLGYYDATAISMIETIRRARPGARPRQGDVTAHARARSTRCRRSRSTPSRSIPADLHHAATCRCKVGDPIEAARIQGAEANVSLSLPQQGYPFVKVGERDILLDDQADRRPATIRCRSIPARARQLRRSSTTEGDPVFDVDHINVFPRFKPGELYDSRKTDDLREALVATGLFSTVAVEPVAPARINADGTEAGRPARPPDARARRDRSPAPPAIRPGRASAPRATWTHRNLFPPEGALIVTRVAGTQEQGAVGHVPPLQRRASATGPSPSIAGASHSNYDAFNAVHRHAVGALELRFDADLAEEIHLLLRRRTDRHERERLRFRARQARPRGTYVIAALPGQVQFDTSDNLLNPTKGFRLKLTLSPETSVRGGGAAVCRARWSRATLYYPVIAQPGDRRPRARPARSQGIARDDLAPSRRYYGGGGGSVRGYGYQRLGPFDPNGDPVGGRSLNEFALEARYRFGNFGIVPFIDARQQL